MGERASPPYRADHVGSLLRPAALLQAREARKRGTMTAPALQAIEDEAIRDAVRMQEGLGFAVVTDGEFRREMFHRDFFEKLDGVVSAPGKISVRFHTHEGEIDQTPAGLRVTGKLRRPRGIFVDDFKFLKSVTRVMPKLTIPSPSTLHFRGGRTIVDEAVYPDIEGFYADLARVYCEEIDALAAAGCRYVQIDEVNLALLCDPKIREQVRSFGEDPARLPRTYAGLTNASIATRPKDMAVCLHLCRGNSRSAWIAEGGYEPVAEILFNEIAVDGYFLEYDTPRAGDFAPLRFVPKGKTVVLGLVTTKSGALESKDELKRRIDEAARYMPMEQLAISPQCGFASGLEGNKITQDDELAKLRLVVEVAREMWG